MNSNFRDAMVSSPQPRNRLENWRGKDDKMSRRMWKAVETNTEEIRVAETKGRGGKRRSRKKTRGEGKEGEAKKGKDGRSKNDSRGVENMEGRSSKIGGGSKETGPRKISLVDQDI